MKERELALAVQGQSYGPMFDEKLTVAAWKTKPTWTVISTKDQMLPPAMQESAAKKMSAITTILSTCHMSILEEPAKVTAVIDDAAKNAFNNQISSRVLSYSGPTRQLRPSTLPGDGQSGNSPKMPVKSAFE